MCARQDWFWVLAMSLKVGKPLVIQRCKTDTQLLTHWTVHLLKKILIIKNPTDLPSSVNDSIFLAIEFTSPYIYIIYDNVVFFCKD